MYNSIITEFYSRDLALERNSRNISLTWYKSLLNLLLDISVLDLQYRVRSYLESNVTNSEA